MNLLAVGGRKFLVALAAIGCCVGSPAAGPYIAAIAVAFFGAHAAADWKRDVTVTAATTRVDPIRP